MTKFFYDFEFTGLHQNTTPVSLGISTSTGEEFYAEFTDYDKTQLDDWLIDNVINKLLYNDEKPFCKTLGTVTLVRGTVEDVSKALIKFCDKFDYIEFWGDCSWYDGVLLNNLLGGANNLPKQVNYIYFDIATLFQVHGIDPDIDREAFIDKPIVDYKHNAMHDARVIEACYEKLRRNSDKYGIVL